jgi:glycosyltransferase involved in cell wall biosynthesis
MKKNVYLVIAGAGPLTNNFRKQIKQDNLEDRVWFLGALAAKNVKRVLQASDIFVHPSHHNEGFPNVVLEAGAAGAYVIATDVAGVREVIIPGKTGKLIPAGDEKAIAQSLSWALTHKAKSKKIAIALRKSLINHFDWRDIVSDYFMLLNQALKHR